MGTNLDVLRARVQLQTQQQALIKAENAFAKDKIALNRLMGIPADQELTLTDTAPYAEFAELPLEDAKKLAYERRKDLLSLESQMEVADRARKAVKYERLPSLAFEGFYGVLGQTGGLYHGVFSAMGKLSVPVFQEGQLRGEREVADGAVDRAEAADCFAEGVDRGADSVGDAGCAVVGRAGEGGAEQCRSGERRQLQQASERFAAGVDDNLPVVQAQATLAAAQSRLVADAVSVQPVEADAGAEYGCGGVAVQDLSGTVGGRVRLGMGA